MICYVYILQNLKCKHYVGITKLEPQKRLIRHNRGDVYSTKLGRPWELIYSEECLSYEQARILEKKIKGWHGGNAFKVFLAKTGGLSNGRTAPFEGVYRGSNPCPPALARKKDLAG